MNNENKKINISNIPSEVLYHIIELDLTSYGNLLATSRSLFYQLDNEDFWIYLTSKNYSSNNVSNLVLAPALDLYHIDLNNRRINRKINLPTNLSVWKYIFRIYFKYIKITENHSFCKRSKNYERKYDFMEALLNKIISKWPWLASTLRERILNDRIPYYGWDEKSFEIGRRFATGRVLVGQYNDVCWMLDVSFDSQVSNAISINHYSIQDWRRDMVLLKSLTYAFPSLSLSNLTEKSVYFRDFSQKFETFLVPFLFQNYYFLKGSWYGGLNESNIEKKIHFYSEEKKLLSLSKILDKEIIKYAKKIDEQIDLYIKHYDWSIKGKIINLLDNPETKRGKSKTVNVAIIRCIRRRLKRTLEPFLKIFDFYQSDKILNNLIILSDKDEELRNNDKWFKERGLWSLFSYKDDIHRFDLKQLNNNYLKSLENKGESQWSIGMQGIAIEILEPLAKNIGLEILKNFSPSYENSLLERIKEREKLNFQRIGNVLEKYMKISNKNVDNYSEVNYEYLTSQIEVSQISLLYGN